MKKYYEYFGLALIMVFSFYYTEKIASFTLNKNPLMQTVSKEAPNYNVHYVNAYIDGNYIIPGINGLEVNKKESFYKMNEAQVFNKYFLVYDQVKPDVSLEDNKEKIINKGNSKLKSVSFILESDNNIASYFKSKDIKADILSTIDTYKKDSYFEVINNDIEGFKSLENTLNLNKENKHICLINDNNKDICIKNKNYLVEPTLILNSSNLIDVKRNIDKGSIILINKNAKLEDVLIILKEVNYKGLDIVYLSELISEKNKLNQ